MLGIFVLLSMYDVNVLLIEEKNLQLNDAFPNKNSSNKLSMYVCMYVWVNYQNSYLPLQFNYNLKT